MPPPNLKLSTYTTHGLVEKEIWSIGNINVAEPQGKTLRGGGDVRVATIKTAQLDLDFDDVPKHHANITGWPNEKEQQKMCAVILAEAAKLYLVCS